MPDQPPTSIRTDGPTSGGAVEAPHPGEEQRRTGRPRAAARQVTGDPVDEILAAASHLFGELGVGGTTMSRIAKEVGLRQSSLYYYFSRKEEILAALVARANVLSLELIRRIAADGGAPAVQLYRFVRGDVAALCALPFDINEIHRVAARDPDGFAVYWDERTALERQVSRIIRAGIVDGVFRDVHVRRTALTVLSNDEGVQNWYRVGKPGPTARLADEVADLCVGGLLADSRTLAEVRSAALAAESAAPAPS